MQVKGQIPKGQIPKDVREWNKRVNLLNWMALESLEVITSTDDYETNELKKKGAVTEMNWSAQLTEMETE